MVQNGRMKWGLSNFFCLGGLLGGWFWSQMDETQNGLMIRGLFLLGLLNFIGFLQFSLFFQPKFLK